MKHKKTQFKSIVDNIKLLTEEDYKDSLLSNNYTFIESDINRNDFNSYFKIDKTKPLSKTRNLEYLITSKKIDFFKRVLTDRVERVISSFNMPRWEKESYAQYDKIIRYFISRSRDNLSINDLVVINDDIILKNINSKFSIENYNIDFDSMKQLYTSKDKDTYKLAVSLLSQINWVDKEQELLHFFLQNKSYFGYTSTGRSRFNNLVKSFKKKYPNILI